MESAFEKSKKYQTTSASRFMGRSVIYGKEDDRNTPYMTRYWFGRLRLHIFYRGDQDPDCHDHPWDFWTFPLTPYVEEVVEPCAATSVAAYIATGEMGTAYRKHLQVVPAWRWTFRPATHTHRVLGRWWRTGWVKGIPMPETKEGRIITIVWRSEDKRKWGFLKNRDGKWCWMHWKEYVFGGGKSAPCE